MRLPNVTRGSYGKEPSVYCPRKCLGRWHIYNYWYLYLYIYVGNTIIIFHISPASFFALPYTIFPHPAPWQWTTTLKTLIWWTLIACTSPTAILSRWTLNSPSIWCSTAVSTTIQHRKAWRHRRRLIIWVDPAAVVLVQHQEKITCKWSYSFDFFSFIWIIYIYTIVK